MQLYEVVAPGWGDARYTYPKLGDRGSHAEAGRAPPKCATCWDNVLGG